MSENQPKHIVKIVGNATSQATDRFKLLGMQQLVLQRLPFCQRLLQLCCPLGSFCKQLGILYRQCRQVGQGHGELDNV